MYKLCSQCSNVVKVTQQKEGSPTQIVKQTNKIWRRRELSFNTLHNSEYHHFFITWTILNEIGLSRSQNQSETEHSTDLGVILNEAGHRIKSEAYSFGVIFNEVRAGHMTKSEVG